MQTSLLTSVESVHAEAFRFRTFLAEKQEDLLKDWLRRRKSMAQQNTRPRRSEQVWIDHLPEVLQAVILGLAPGEETDEDTSRIHTLQRCLHGFTAEETVEDLYVLGTILREQLLLFIGNDPNMPAAPALKLAQDLSEIIDTLVGESVRTFFQLRNREQQLREQIVNRKLQVVSEEYSETCEAVDGYSHDLKGCTDTLIQLTEFIRQKLGNEADAYLSALARGLRYNYKILADLEALSRDPLHTDPVCLELSELIRDIWERQVFPGSRANTMTVQWLTSQDLSVHANALALERVLSNLIDNAIHHGEPNQHIQIGWWKDPDESVRIEIENLTPATLLNPEEKVNDWSPVALFPSEGTGISVVRNLLREMDGHLWYRNMGNGRVRARVRIEHI